VSDYDDMVAELMAEAPPAVPDDDGEEGGHQAGFVMDWQPVPPGAPAWKAALAGILIAAVAIVAVCALAAAAGGR